jgi:hypothetical protein
MSKAREKKAVVIFDSHRGICFGYLEKITNAGKTVKLSGARHCFYFVEPPSGNKGVFSLGTIGPQDGSKISPRVTVTINDVTSIVECTQDAVVQWEKIVW